MARPSSGSSGLELESEDPRFRWYGGFALLVFSVLYGWAILQFPTSFEEVTSAPLTALLYPGILAAVGLWLRYGEVHLTLDRSKGRVRRYHTLGFPLYFTTVPWEQIEAVVLESFKRKVKNSSSYHTVYRVSLRGQRAALNCSERRDVHQARELARRLASMLERPFCDVVEGRVLPLEHSEASLKERLSLQGVESPSSEVPPGVEVQHYAGALRMRVEPPPGSLERGCFWTFLRVGCLFSLLPMLVVVTQVIVPQYRSGELHSLVFWFLALLAVFGLIYRGDRVACRKDETVEEYEVNSHEFIVRSTWRGRTTENHYLLSEIADIAVDDNKGVLLILNGETVTLAQSTEPEAKEWIHAALAAHIVGISSDSRTQ